MKKLIILTLLLIAPIAHGASWETTGNFVNPADMIGSYNSQDVSFVRGGAEKLRLTTDGLRFMNPLLWIADSNGQVVLNHLTGGGTALYGFGGTRMINLTANGVEIVGNLIAKTNYTEVSTPYTLLPNDYTVESSSDEIIIPDATTANKGKRYEIINTGSNIVKIHNMSGQQIGNAYPIDSYLVEPDQSVTLVSSGSAWRVIK